MKQIYMLCGTTGSYDDIVRWNVEAYSDGLSAVKRLEALTKLLEENGLHMKLGAKSRYYGANLDHEERDKAVELIRGIDGGDPTIPWVDNTGVKYYIDEVPFITTEEIE